MINVRTPSTIIAIALAGALLGTQVLGRRPAPPRPPSIAMVRIVALFDGLEQRADAKAEIEQLEGELRQESERRAAEMTRHREALKQIADPADRAAEEDALALEEVTNQLWLKESLAELEVEKALRLKYLYINVKQAIKELAEAEEYDLVLVDDSIKEPGFEREMRVLPQVQVLQQMTSTKVLYLVERIDITNDLIVRMNNAFKAGPGP